MNTVSRGFRNAFRNVIRTSSIVIILGISIGLALTMFIAHQAVTNKINQVKSSVGNTITITPAGFSGFSQVNNSLTTTQLAKVSTVPNVVSVDETLTDRLTTIGSSTPSFGFGGGGQSSSSSNTNNQTSLTSPVTINTSGAGGGHFFISGGGSLPTNFTPPVTIDGSTEPLTLGTTNLTMSSGQELSGSSNSDDAMISTSMAAKNNLKVGSTFTAYGTTMTVVGIFNASATDTGAGTVIVSLPTLQRLTNQAGDVTSAVVTVNSLDNLSAATTAIQNQLGSAATVTSAQTEANNTVQPLNSVKTISLYSVIGAVIAGGLITLLTMVMIVRERRREIGVLKAIGSSNVNVMTQFASEAITLTGLGAIVGIIIGVLAANPITKLLINNSSSSTTTTPGRGGFGGGGGFGGAPGGGGTGRFVGSGRGVGGFLHSDVTNVHAVIGWDIIIYGFVAAIIIGAIGSAFVSFFIARVRPAEVMRGE